MNQVTTYKAWTDNGLKDLSRLIKSSRLAKGYSLSKFSALIKERTGTLVSDRTINNIENGNSIPHYNTLAAIAAAGIVVDGKGKPLSIDDFIDVACEIYKLELGRTVSVEKLAALIREYLKAHCLSVNNFSRMTHVAEEKLRQILDGTFYGPVAELMAMLSAIQDFVNPETGMPFRTWVELADFCGIPVEDREQLEFADSCNAHADYPRRGTP